MSPGNNIWHTETCFDHYWDNSCDETYCTYKLCDNMNYDECLIEQCSGCGEETCNKYSSLQSDEITQAPCQTSEIMDPDQFASVIEDLLEFGNSTDVQSQLETIMNSFDELSPEFNGLQEAIMKDVEGFMENN